jgi:hypothetical protein
VSSEQSTARCGTKITSQVKKNKLIHNFHTRI